MEYSNIKKAIDMCGSAKTLHKFLEKYNYKDLPAVLKVAKDVDWDRNKWRDELKGLKSQDPISEYALEIINDRDVIGYLKTLEPSIQWDKYRMTITIHLKVNKGVDILETLNNPYIHAQIQQAADLNLFKQELQRGYQIFINTKLPKIKEEDRNAKALEFVLALIQECGHRAGERAHYMFNREHNLEGLISWRKKERYSTGGLAILGAIGSTVGAGLSVAATVMSMGGTILGSALAIHGAMKSIYSAGNTLRIFTLGYENALNMAIENLRFIEKMSAESGEQKSTGVHVASAALQTLIGDLAAPYDNARKQFENADYKLAQIETELQSMGRNIQTVLDLTDELLKLERLFTAKCTELPEDMREDDVFKSFQRQIQNIKEQSTGLEIHLNTLLIRTVEMAAPTQKSLSQLAMVQQKLVEFQPTKLASGLGLLIKGLHLAATTGLNMAAESKDIWNMAQGEVNDQLREASMYTSATSASLAIAQPIWNKCRKTYAVEK